MNIKKRIVEWFVLFGLIITIVGNSDLTEAKDVSYENGRMDTYSGECTFRTNEIQKGAKKVRLNVSSVELWKKDYYILTLYNASKEVLWSSSGKIVKLKKGGNQVVVYQKGSGPCYVRAKYKGKTYTCKVVCHNKLEPDVFEVRVNKPITLDCSSDLLDTDSVTVYCRRVRGVTVHISIEDPSIVTCRWRGSGLNLGEEWGAFNWLEIGALRPGKTRLILSNSYNKEKEYINVVVTNKYGSPIIEENPNYDPLA